MDPSSEPDVFDSETRSSKDLLKRASEAFRLDRIGEAKRLYLLALEQMDRGPSDEEIAAHRGLTLVYLSSGDFDHAHSHLDHAMSIAQRLAHTKLIIKLQNTRGDLLYSEGKMAEAGSLFSEALSKARHQGYDDMVPSLLSSLGNVHFHQQDLDGARRNYNEALELLRGQGDVGLQALVENGLGECCTEVSDWDQALEHYQRSLALVTQLDEPLRVAISHHNIGEVLIELGRWEEAESHLKISINEGLRVQDSNFFVRPATSLAILWRLLDRPIAKDEILSLIVCVDPEFLQALSPLAEKRRGSLGTLPRYSMDTTIGELRLAIKRQISQK